MPDNISRAVFDSLLPPGPIWEVAEEEDFDKLLDGIAANSEGPREFLEALANLRDFQKTPILSDLEKEYGIQPNNQLTEQERRDRGEAVKTARSGFGADFMQARLQAAGFDVQVHINNPPVDPDIFLFKNYNIIFGASTPSFGNAEANFGGVGGELVVNGDFFIETPLFSFFFGPSTPSFGNSEAVFGATDGDAIDEELIEYTIPSDPGYWGLFFFVGGVATRNATTGELETIAPAAISGDRREEIRREIIKYKPSHSWCGLIVNYV